MGPWGRDIQRAKQGEGKGDDRVNVATVRTIREALDELSRQPLWPAFEPSEIPVVIYDGEDTWLLRHPHPGFPFGRWADSEDLWMMPGLHDSVRANTATIVDGVPTAALMLASLAGRSPLEAAAVCIHEMFHVFQRDHYPTWVGDVGAMFLYPLSDPALLTMRRLETEAWRRAQAASDPSARHGWARTALRCRAARFLALPPACPAFERGTELSEGLAQYVEHRALGITHVTLPAEGYPPDQARGRCYAIGALMGTLLDEVAPGWPGAVDASAGLDGLLDAALGQAGAAWEFTAAEHEHIAQRAHADDSAFTHHREQRLRDVRSEPGHRIVLRGRTPLRTQGFDPSNCLQLNAATVLHTRFLHVTSAHLELEVLGGKALTRAAGEHALFGGLAEVVCVGLSHLPVLAPGTTHLAWRGDGVSIQGEADRLTIRDNDLVIDLP